jgi:hypothetical protein
MSDDKLKEVITELEKSRALQRGAWQRVIETGRKYAQLKATGTVIDADTGSLVSVSHSGQEARIRMYEQSLLQAVEQAYLEDAQMGATFSNHVG